jgi:acylglycerol lipase
MLLRDLQAEIVWRDVAAFVADPAAALPSAAPALIKPSAAEKSLTAAR